MVSTGCHRAVSGQCDLVRRPSSLLTRSVAVCRVNGSGRLSHDGGECSLVRARLVAAQQAVPANAATGNASRVSMVSTERRLVPAADGRRPR